MRTRRYCHDINTTTKIPHSNRQKQEWCHWGFYDDWCPLNDISSPKYHNDSYTSIKISIKSNLNQTNDKQRTFVADNIMAAISTYGGSCINSQQYEHNKHTRPRDWLLRHYMVCGYHLSIPWSHFTNKRTAVLFHLRIPLFLQHRIQYREISGKT